MQFRSVPHRPVVLLAVAACVVVGACGGSSSSSAVPGDTTVPLQPTAWPNGTVGAFGLRIDPGLLGTIPRTAGGLPLIESAPTEITALDTSDDFTRFDRFAAAEAGQLSETGNSDWISVSIGHVRDADQTDDFLASWRDEFFEGACSHADGVKSQAQETINDWPVDTAVCTGGPLVYVLWTEDGNLLSIQDLGPRHLGRELINALQ